HDHRRWNEFVANPHEEFTLLIGSGSHARAVAIVSVMLVTQNINDILRKEIRGNIIDITRNSPSSQFAVNFLEYLYPVQQYADEFITFSHDTIKSRLALHGSSAFVDLVHQAQLSITGADVSLAAPFLIDVTIPSGNLTRRDFFKLYRFENYLYVMTLSGSEIKDILEYSYANWMNHMRSEFDNLLLKRTDDQGLSVLNRRGRTQLATPHFDFESAAGIKYTVNVAMPPGNRVSITGFENGLPFKADSIYHVAINSYRASGGGGHLTTGAGIPRQELKNRIVWQSETFIRSMLMDWMKNNPAYRIEARKNWMVVPRTWAERGIQKDLRLLFED
ncbi:MAG TPA: 5'-nucleotidase, partial [Bacteroidales bacterium]|nr:5'-nucleotidase [Bacteroidales bacterium]